MIRTNRAEFLQKLELVQAGLSPRGIIDQSNCFVFLNGGIYTFNGEICCFHSNGLDKDVKGAVQANALLAQLSKWKEDEIEIEIEADLLWIYGMKRKAWFNLEKEIHLPVDSVEVPETWIELPQNFSEAVNIVQSCAGRDQSKFQLTCVHIHPEWIEASDDVQISRYKLKTGIPEKTLVRQSALKNIPSLGMRDFAVTKTWIHFRNAVGLSYSCLRYLDEFPEVGNALDISGTPTVFPKSLNEAIERAEIFSAENSENNQVTVEMRPGKLRVKGLGSSGGYTEVKDVQYEGKPFAFSIAPKMLSEITRRHNEVFIDEEKILVDGGSFIYRTCLGIVEDEK